MKTYGVIEPPAGLILREEETIEWHVTYYDPDSHYRQGTFIIHSSTSEGAERAINELFPGKRILKIEYIGTYQY